MSHKMRHPMQALPDMESILVAVEAIILAFNIPKLSAIHPTL
jgi:hypothetical protein